MYKPKLYVGGAIRDGVDADIVWRKEFWSRLSELYHLLDPTNGKRYVGHEHDLDKREFGAECKEWRFMGRYVPDARTIWCQDRSNVKVCDVGIWNLNALQDGYPCIGSSVEIGWANAWDKLIYIIYSKPDKIHPFWLGGATRIFADYEEAIDYLTSYASVLSGKEL